MAVQLPLDRLRELWPQELRGVRASALLHPASVSSKLEHASRVLERLNGDLFQLSAFFGPQHGFLGQTQDNMVEWTSYEHPRLHIPVTAFTENIASRRQKCSRMSMFSLSIFRMSARVITLLFGRSIFACARARSTTYTLSFSTGRIQLTASQLKDHRLRKVTNRSLACIQFRCVTAKRLANSPASFVTRRFRNVDCRSCR